MREIIRMTLLVANTTLDAYFFGPDGYGTGFNTIFRLRFPSLNTIGLFT